jgi:hypothetical protein
MARTTTNSLVSERLHATRVGRDIAQRSDAELLPDCKQVPVPKSQVDPVGQQAAQRGPGHGKLPGGQRVRLRGVSQMPQIVAPVQPQAPLGDASGQHVASSAPHAPPTHRQAPALHVALSWHCLPQVPQLRGSVSRSTQAPLHSVVPAEQTHVPPRQIPAPLHAVPLVFGRHLPFLHRFLPSFLVQRPSLHVRHSPHAGRHLRDLAYVS